MYRTPSHSLATRIYTCVQFLRSDDEGVYAAEPLELAQTNTLETADEGSEDISIHSSPNDMN